MVISELVVSREKISSQHTSVVTVMLGAFVFPTCLCNAISVAFEWDPHLE